MTVGYVVFIVSILNLLPVATDSHRELTSNLQGSSLRPSMADSLLKPALLYK